MVREVKFSFDEFDERNNPHLSNGLDQYKNDDWEAEDEAEDLVDDLNEWEESEFENQIAKQPITHFHTEHHTELKHLNHLKHLNAVEMFNDSIDRDTTQ